MKWTKKRNKLRQKFLLKTKQHKLLIKCSLKKRIPKNKWRHQKMKVNPNQYRL